MANLHFTHTPNHPKAHILLGSLSVTCSVLERSTTQARIRVLNAGSVPEYLSVAFDDETRRARVALRKQGALGLDLWLDLLASETAAAA
ncbi:hypothetical protein [Methylobacterium dankookense]|uniref:PilZ domain-containing protein n=1 Tax=Methylobacterium dankookense TaxID=560405 RepID=A0A564G5N4_9HYPH|nr:hypothetical protein [Methylobacterium dankookense]GJD59041.1 hypothetical protein IFDJLNFL_4967 [Methylobacterium dankookense]VUF15865.1 hypothetical protein MTDSW087_05613 [Methylobacterium dankookense]